MKHLLRSISAFLAAALIMPVFMGIPAEAATGVQINNTSNFPDANFRAVVKGYDTDGNGYLSDYEISRVMNVVCENKGITNLKGIEFFTDVQGIWCANNKIKSINLKNNKDLRGLWCSGNPITSLDFSENKELVWVYCFDCNLSSLDFSNNPHLAYLECNTNTNLSKLNLKNNKELEHLMCGSCALHELDFTPNPNLCHLDAFRNKMTKLNITNNTKLKRLNVWDNPDLGNVSVSHLPELQFLCIANTSATKVDVTHNPQLQKLMLSWNDVKTLDLSKNPRLAYLSCGDNPIDELDISNNPQLYFLETYINNFTSINIGNNSRLLKTYKNGTKKNEANVAGYSYTIDYGGSNEFGVELFYFLCVGNNCKKIETTASQVKDRPDSTTDTNDGHSDSADFMTREMVIQTLYELAGKPSTKNLKTRFTDVEAGAWYEDAIKWGQSKKICLGYPNICDDTFGVGEQVTRQDLALMLHRYATAVGYKTAFDYGRTDWFDDFKNIDYHAWGPFTWAIQWEYLLPDKSGKYCYPRGRVTRDELEKAIIEMYVDNGDKAPSKVPIPSSDVNDLVKVPAKAATCTEAGNSAYWVSKTSGKFYKDALGKTEIAENSWIIDPLGHLMTHVDAKEAKCTTAGNIEYYKCTRCGKCFKDQAGSAEISAESVTVPATGHKLVKTEAKTETCTENGNSAYWTCSQCGKFFADSKGEQEIKKDSWIIPAGHKEKEAIVAATFDKDGHVKTTCTVCGDTLKDEVIPHLAEAKLAGTQFAYTGSVINNLVKVTDSKGNIVTPDNYTYVFYDANGNAVEEAVNVGTYSVSLKFKHFYKGSTENLGTFKIVKAANPLKIKGGKKYTVKYKVLKKAKQKVPYTSVITFTNKGQGTLIFKKKSGNKKIKISKAGMVTIKKKLRKGTYKIKVKVTAAGNSNYKSSSTKTVTFKIKVK